MAAVAMPTMYSISEDEEIVDVETSTVTIDDRSINDFIDDSEEEIETRKNEKAVDKEQTGQSEEESPTTKDYIYVDMDHEIRGSTRLQKYFTTKRSIGERLSILFSCFIRPKCEDDDRIEVPRLY